jgi:hypothetical protein
VAYNKKITRNYLENITLFKNIKAVLFFITNKFVTGELVVKHVGNYPDQQKPKPHFRK